MNYLVLYRGYYKKCNSIKDARKYAASIILDAVIRNYDSQLLQPLHDRLIKLIKSRKYSKAIVEFKNNYSDNLLISKISGEIPELQTMIDSIDVSDIIK